MGRPRRRRPGEEAHLGVIVRTAEGRGAPQAGLPLCPPAPAPDGVSSGTAGTSDEPALDGRARRPLPFRSPIGRTPRGPAAGGDGTGRRLFLPGGGHRAAPDRAQGDGPEGDLAFGASVPLAVRPTPRRRSGPGRGGRVRARLSPLPTRSRSRVSASGPAGGARALHAPGGDAPSGRGGSRRSDGSPPEPERRRAAAPGRCSRSRSWTSPAPRGSSRGPSDGSRPRAAVGIAPPHGRPSRPGWGSWRAAESTAAGTRDPRAMDGYGAWGPRAGPAGSGATRSRRRRSAGAPSRWRVRGRVPFCDPATVRSASAWRRGAPAPAVVGFTREDGRTGGRGRTAGPGGPLSARAPARPGRAGGHAGGGRLLRGRGPPHRGRVPRSSSPSRVRPRPCA